MSTGEIHVRPATLADIEGIREIHAQCEDPWGNWAECALWINHRLLRGFFIDLAIVQNKIAGHAEWTRSRDPAPYGRCLYLGMIQIHEAFQRRGVGRAMIQSGIEKAKAHNCPVIRTISDPDATGFYRACGFVPRGRTVSYKIPCHPAKLPSGWTRLRSVPQRAFLRFQMRSGWVQASSEFMWELCNRPVKAFGDTDRHPCAARLDGKGYVQLRYVGPVHNPLIVSWAPETEPLQEHLEVALALSQSLPVESLLFVVRKEDEPALQSSTQTLRTGTDKIWTYTLT